MSEPRAPQPSSELLEKYAEHFSESMILKTFGAKVSFPKGEKVLVRIDPVRPEMRGGLGTQAVNGGVLAAVFDLAIGCTPALIDPTRRSATVQLSMSFEHPVRGDWFTAEAEIDSFGQSTVFASARISDQNGQVCARCQGLSKLSSIPWKSGISPGDV